MDPTSVNWHLLPERPEEFFGLPAEYDRKELKKCYHRLIKQFKPERYPVEFQRIRSAFEELDERLRYASQFDSTLPFAHVVTHFEVSTNDGSLPQYTQNDPGTKSVIDQLNDKETPQLYRDLIAKGPSSPSDYFVLAALSDIVKPDENLGFVQWILKGLEQFPGDGGLTQLLYGFCRTDLETKEAAKLVQLSAKVVNGPLYYFLTEHLWLQLLMKLPFPKFAQLLEKCESQLRGDVLVAKLTFYTRLVKMAAWRASNNWLKQQVAFLEENSDLMPRVLHYELELLDHIMNYRLGRAEFLDGTNVRSLMDNVFKTYSEGDDLQSERAFLEFQLYVQKNPDEVLAAFPMGQPVFEPAFILFQILSSEMESRLLDDSPSDPRTYVHRVHELLRSEDKRTNSSFCGLIWVGGIWLFNVALYVVLIAPVIAVMVHVPELFWLLVPWLGIWYFSCYKYIRPKVQRWWVLTFSRIMYLRSWRDAAIRLVRVSRIDPFSIAQIMSLIEDDTIDINRLYSHYISQDPALSLFAYSHRFV